MRRVLLAGALAALVAASFGCTPLQTAAFFNKPVDEVTAADQDLALDMHRHNVHARGFLICTRYWESDRGDANGNGLHDAGYHAYNGTGPYLGAYQFLQSTWNSVARSVGRYDLVGVDPRWAEWWDQDDMAWNLYLQQGNRPWGGRC
jgi:hypothetical protein